MTLVTLAITTILTIYPAIMIKDKVVMPLAERYL